MRREVKCSYNRIKVYKLAVDGRGEEQGYTIPEIAKLIGLNKETVRLILKQLEKEEYVVRDKRSKSPISFRRGRLAGVMDEVVLKTKVDAAQGATPDLVGNNIDQEIANDTKSRIINVHTLRTHQNGFVRFDVEKIGDMHRIKVPDEQGVYSELLLFPKSPNRDNYSQSWFAELTYENKTVSIHFFDSKRFKYIIIPPPEVELTRAQIPSAKDLLIVRANKVTFVLTKYGGWKLGEPTLVGTTEYSDTDSPLLSLMPPIPKTEGLSIWVDRSHGKEEVETHDPSMVNFITDPFGKENYPKQTPQEILARLSALGQIACHNTLAIGKLVHLLQSVFDAAINPIGSSQSGRTKEEPVTSDKAPVGKEDYGGMYR